MMPTTTTNNPDPLDGLSLDATDVLALFGLLAATLVVNNILQKQGVPIPEAISTIAIGVVAGAVASLFPSVNRNTFQKLEDTTARQFMLIFVAPIIFAEGYGMKSHRFFENISRILTHAFLGTFISTLVVGMAVFYLVPAFDPGLTPALSLAECLSFGAMISSTDPVTTLAIFKEMHMVENGLSHLYYSVLGESILNDAVAITLFSSFSSVVTNNGRISADTSLEILGSFCENFLSSLVIGVLGGGLASLVLKFGRLGRGGSSEENFYFNVPELGVAIATAYLPFLAAEAVGYSGIVAVMFAGITMRRYAHYNLTDVTRQVFLPTIELLASLCETYVFVLLGLGVFLLSDSYNAAIIIVSLLACLVGRAFQVYPISCIMNSCSTGPKISLREQHVVWFAGLRGAVAFMCALGFPQNDTSKHRSLFLCTTVVIVGVTIVFLGWPTGAVLNCLKIQGSDESQIPLYRQSEQRSVAWWSRTTDVVIGRGSTLIRRFLMTEEAMRHREEGELATSSAFTEEVSCQRVSGELMAEGAGLHRAVLLSAGPWQQSQLGTFGLSGGGGHATAASTGRPSTATERVSLGTASLGGRPSGGPTLLPLQLCPSGVRSSAPPNLLTAMMDSSSGVADDNAHCNSSSASHHEDHHERSTAIASEGASGAAPSRGSAHAVGAPPPSRAAAPAAAQLLSADEMFFLGVGRRRSSLPPRWGAMSTTKSGSLRSTRMLCDP
mmetsp:Transcript_10625/g.23199  ORF Transcript_10625/g.23199 Transcript_10625/m.23199 type:complete len:724 (-) Transcript_10625:92-2263(-)